MNIQKIITISYIGLIFQSCSAQTDRLNLRTVQKEDFKEYPMLGGAFHNETDREIDKLEREGFIGGPSDTDDIDIKKHLMFVLFHSLKFKRSSTSIQERIDFFNDEDEDGDAKGLMYRAVDVTEETEGEEDERKKIAFELKHLFTEEDPSSKKNIDKICRGIAPGVEVVNNFFLVKGDKVPGSKDQKVHIDHLLKDNTNTVELPVNLHLREKTKYLDKIISAPEDFIQRDSKKY